VKNNISIEFPQPKDLEGVVRAQGNAWIDTYISPENGVGEEWVREVTASRSAAYIAERLDEYRQDPNILYLVAKAENGEVAGFVHAERRGSENEILAIYLDPEYIGKGVGGVLMETALDWVDDSKPTYLEVTSYNERAIGFYNHYGFTKTDKPITFFKDVMPVIEMMRPAEPQ
jgi:GNAT superfamily N-acetyltransferase